MLGDNAKVIQWVKTVFSINIAGKVGYSYAERKKKFNFYMKLKANLISYEN
jgi:hypothetical protein